VLFLVIIHRDIASAAMKEITILISCLCIASTPDEEACRFNQYT
jgi:hypothetical protein